VDDPGLYDTRFSARERAAKQALWRVLCAEFFQRYVPRDATLLDLGAGFGEFVNHIACREKWALELDTRIRGMVGPDVHVHVGSADDLSWRASGSVDVVFASNVFEHFRDKDGVLACFREVSRVLRDGGRFLVIQPNIRFAYREYWDFFDHHLPFSDRAMCEGLVTCGFHIDECRPRFLPLTTKSRLPSSPVLVRLYLRVPIAQRLLGKQMFLVARKARVR
jgi:SAM-dependent methyltransferase